MRDIGEALVTWSEVEAIWRVIFPRVLFRDFDHANRKDELRYGIYLDGHPATLRANALWDSLNSSAAQLDLVLAAAPLSLTAENQRKGLANLLLAGKETHSKRSLRNAVAHSGFERQVRTQSGTQPGTFMFVPSEMTLADNAHSAIRGQDPHEAVPRIISEFKIHREKVRAVHTWLVMDYPADADVTLLDRPPSP